MERAQLEANIRKETGSNACKHLRRKGLTPAVAYGHRFEPICLSVNAKDLFHLIAHHGARNLIDLIIKDNGEVTRETVLVKEIQRHPVTQQVLAVDFQRVSLTEKVTTTVPIVLVGEAAGVKMGGILEQQIHEVDVECLPLDLPEEINVDITHLRLGDSLSVREIPEIRGVSILADPDEVVVHISPPRVGVVEVEEAAAAEESGEPAHAGPKGAGDEE